MRRLILALLLVPAFCVFSYAEEEEHDEDDDDRVWEELERRVSFDFKGGTTLTEAISFFTATAKINIVLHRDVREKLGKSAVTLKLTRVPLIQAVRAMAASQGLECVEMENGILLLKFPPPDRGEPAGKLSLKMGSLMLELNIKRGDLPPDARREIIDRALHVMEFEADMRERKMQKFRRDMEAKEEMREKKEWRGQHELKEGGPGEGKKAKEF